MYTNKYSEYRKKIFKIFEDEKKSRFFFFLFLSKNTYTHAVERTRAQFKVLKIKVS